MRQYALSKQQRRFRINKQVNKIRAKTCVLPENLENHADMLQQPTHAELNLPHTRRSQAAIQTNKHPILPRGYSKTVEPADNPRTTRGQPADNPRDNTDSLTEAPACTQVAALPKNKYPELIIT